MFQAIIDWCALGRFCMNSITEIQSLSLLNK